MLSLQCKIHLNPGMYGCTTADPPVKEILGVGYLRISDTLLIIVKIYRLSILIFRLMTPGLTILITRTHKASNKDLYLTLS
jgi:hypothetical protein